MAKTKVKEKEKKTKISYSADLYNDVLDTVEKDVGISSEEIHDNRLSTGILSIDLIIGGGMRYGMITIVGLEAGGKSTLLMHMLGEALQVKIPIIEMQDAEGCLIGTDKVLTTNGYISFDKLFEIMRQHNKTIEEVVVEVVTPEGKNIVAELYDGGVQQTTHIETQKGNTLTGFKHPILIINNDGSGEWKNIEDLKEGDKVLSKT